MARKFTKTHNDLKWLFPIVETDKEAEQKFKDVEDQAKYLAEMAGVEEKDKDLAIDCFMKGYSQALQFEMPRVIKKYIDNIYKNLLELSSNYLDDEKEQEKWFRFHKFEDLIKHLAYEPADTDRMKKYRDYLVEILEKSGFNYDGPREERAKLY